MSRTDVRDMDDDDDYDDDDDAQTLMIVRTMFSNVSR